MNILNEKVEHNLFGLGTITEVQDNKIRVEFKEEVGAKMFLYPDAFENFLKATDDGVEGGILEDLHTKQEKLEQQRLEKERKEAEYKEKMEKSLPKRKSVRKTVKKKV